MSTFKIRPEELHMIGQQIIDESNAFGQNVKKIYENIEELTNKSYLSNEAIVIANKILSGEPGYVEKYKNMLSLGRTKDSIELLKMVDVDLENAETYKLAFKYYEDSLNKLKELLK